MERAETGAEAGRGVERLRAWLFSELSSRLRTHPAAVIKQNWAARKAANPSQTLIFFQSFCFFQTFKKV